MTHTINSEINFRINRGWEGNASTIDTYSYLSANIRKKFAEPCVAAVYGYVDALIQPRDTLARMIAALEVLHGLADENPHPKTARKSPILQANFARYFAAAGIGYAVLT